MIERKPTGTTENRVGEISPDDSPTVVSHEEIARLTYALWELRGGADGGAEEDWLEAERQLRTRTAKAHA